MRIAIALLGLSLLAGCTVVSCDRVFPKVAWYWTKEAKLQRESDAREEAGHQEYLRSLATNSPSAR